MKKVETFLPIFQGFYGTIFDVSDIDLSEFMPDNVLPSAEPEIDFASYKNDAAREITDSVERMLEDFVFKIVFQKLISPREYNFANDSINCIIYPKMKVIREYLKTHESEWAEYLKDRYTSRSGFISSYPNTVHEWIEETKNLTELDGHYLGSILEFISANEGFSEWDIELDTHISSYVTWNELEEIERLEKLARENYVNWRLNGAPENLTESQSIDVPEILNKVFLEIESHTLSMF